MKSGRKTRIYLVGGLALTMAAGVKAVTDVSTNAPRQTLTQTQPGDNGDAPYSSIWLRNVFDLKPPPPPKVEEAPKPAQPPPKVHLTGITTLFGKQAMFMVQDSPEPGKPSRPDRSVILKEGQRQDDLEVLEIHPKERKVKIKIEELVSTITFETNRAPSGAPAMAAGHPPGAPGGGMPQRPVRQQQGFGQASPSSQASPYSGAGSQPNYGQQANQPAYGGGYGGGYSQAGASQASATPPDVQAALMMANHVAHQDEIAAGIYPPIPLSPDMKDLLSSGQNSSTSGSQSAQPPTVPSPLGQRVTGTLPPLPP